MKKAVIIIISVLAGLLLLVFGAQWFLASKIRKAVDKQLPEITNGAYDGNIGAVRVNLFNRSVKLKDISIRSDAGHRPDSLAGTDLYLNIKSISLGGIKFRSRDHLKEVSARSLDIRSPHINFTERVKEPDENEDPESLLDRLHETFSSLGVSHITVSDGQISYGSVDGSDTLQYDIRGLDLKIDGFLIDTAAVSSKRVLYSDDIYVKVDDFTHTYLAGTMLLHITGVEADTRRGNARVASLEMIPQLSKDRFAWVAPGHADWTQLIIGEITCEGIDVARLQSENYLRVERVDIDGLDIDSYKNRKIKRIEKVKPLLHETLQDLPFGLEVGVLEVKNAKASYEELALNGDRPGQIYFTALNGTFTDLANITRPDKPYFTLDASARLMGAGLLKAHFNIPTGKGNDRFSISGTLGKMNMEPLNRMIEPLIRGQVKSGTIDGVSFSMSGNSKTAYTKLEFLYDDLKIEIMKDRQTGPDTERRFLSGLANFLLIKDSNPDKWGTRSTESTSRRDPYRSQFNYLWKMLLPGLKETIGIPDKNAETDRDPDDLEGFDGRPGTHYEGIFDRDRDDNDNGNGNQKREEGEKVREGNRDSDHDENVYRGLFGRRNRNERRG